ncbi:hypothetical protein [Nocardia sp. CA-120079]|uniref:hypothetical protein n=1 Tax=Nocardia sp. CA-120079 TaxID=3239974 RepID=UPI003D98BB27
MSKGLGAKQRMMLIALAEWDYEGRRWIAWTDLELFSSPERRDRATSKAERASWRRAVRSLEQRRFVECHTAVREDGPHESGHDNVAQILHIRITPT